MRPYIFPILLAAIAIGGAIISSPTTDTPIEAAEIDIVGLHNQAESAMRLLQVSHERRMALQQVSEEAF